MKNVWKRWLATLGNWHKCNDNEICHDMYTLSASLSLCVGNQLFTLGFPGQNTSNRTLIGSLLSSVDKFINKEWSGWWKKRHLNTLRPRQNGRHFPDDIFKRIWMKMKMHENVWISINISLKFVPRGPLNNNQTLVQAMAWRWPGDKPLLEPMMLRLSTHICVTRPQWVNLCDITPMWILQHWLSHPWYPLAWCDILASDWFCCQEMISVAVDFRDFHCKLLFRQLQLHFRSGVGITKALFIHFSVGIFYVAKVSGGCGWITFIFVRCHHSYPPVTPKATL